MRIRTGVFALALALGATGTAVAQQGVALTPYIGYLVPSGNLVDQFDATCCMTLKTHSGIMVGGIGELSLSKHFALGLFAASTIGLSQKANFDQSTAGGSNLDLGMATTQFGGTFIVRPMGRNPNGSPKVFFLEAGAAYQALSFSDITDRNSSNASPSWNHSGGVGIFGGGFTFRVGPRATMVLFGRYNMALAAYSSPGLTAWNSVPCGATACPDTPKKVSSIFIGAGLRTGR